MATALQTALARGFAALSGVAGESWTFGAASFVGVLGSLRPDDPRMAGAADRSQVLSVQASALPTPRPTRGKELTRGTDIFTVSRVDEQPSGIVEIMIHPAS